VVAMDNNTGGKFRKKQINFSIVSNNIIRDETISLKAKGLYALIQSYITMDNFTLYKGFLMNKCKEGERAFDAAWKELKDNGYLIQYKMREGAKSFYYEYELLDEPIQPIQQGQQFQQQQSDSLEMSDSLHPQNVPLQNVGVENVDLQNVQGTKRRQYNNTIQNNTIQSNIVSNHISSDDVKKQIDYDNFDTNDKRQVDNFVLIIAEIYNMDDSESIRVNSNQISVRAVKQRFKQISHEHIQYILLVMKDFTGHIDNIRQYIITTLYNAPATMDCYYQNRVANDMYNNDNYKR
jgi:hypothetical protein